LASATERRPEGPERARPLSLMYQRPRNLAYLGAAFLLAGRLDDARSTIQQALDLCRAHCQRGFEAEALQALGEIYASLGPSEWRKAESAHRNALALAEELGMCPLVAHCHFGLGRLHRHTGDRHGAEDNFATAATMYREMDMRFWLEKSKAEMRIVG
jgi:tetratricopeptide (TPR) repeat protein